jgi:outer membrane protein
MLIKTPVESRNRMKQNAPIHVLVHMSHEKCDNFGLSKTAFKYGNMKSYKNLILIAIVALCTVGKATAQRIAVIDIQAVLESLDDYQQSQKELDRIAAEWRQEISQEYDKIKTMYNKYQAEQVLLSEEARKAKEDEIMEAEQQVRQMQKDRFGPDGTLFQKRQDMVRPIQDRVYGAIEDYADDRGYDFIFDKGGTGGLIYSNSEYDKTDDIIRRLSGN